MGRGLPLIFRSFSLCFFLWFDQFTSIVYSCVFSLSSLVSVHHLARFPPCFSIFPRCFTLHPFFPFFFLKVYFTSLVISLVHPLPRARVLISPFPRSAIEGPIRGRKGKKWRRLSGVGRAREGGREEVVVSRRSSRTRASGEAAPAVVAVAFCYRRLPCCTCRVDQSRRTFVCSQRARTVIGGPEQRARNLRVVGAPFLECRRRFWAPRSTCFCLAPLSWFMPQRLLLFLFCFLIFFFVLWRCYLLRRGVA